ncbi:MAG TPA: phosphate acyltransferase PlsX [Verrucomicrobiae bacterium]|nr:phosphate acyltransferase PlsX [Verrucomicrobiae bacterium]
MDLSAVRGATSDRRVRVAVDAMGGDHAPEEVVLGALIHARAHPEDDLLLVGDEIRVRAIAGLDLPANIRFVHASEVVGMDEHAAQNVRTKKDASINVAMKLVHAGQADAVVTAGHTGACVAAAYLHLHRAPGVDRPALAVQMVTESGPFVLLDIGATTNSTGEQLYQFAEMGSLFSERILGVERPRVALLSIGEEMGKGDARIQRATALLQASSLNFIGNVEGKDLVKHLADVVVCDAVVGNVVIKFFEGLSQFIFGLLTKEFERLPFGPPAYVLMRPGIRRIRRIFDYEASGGAPLLGVKGTVIITHGRAKRRMVSYAVAVGAGAARARIPELIAETFQRTPPPPSDAAVTQDSAQEPAP